MISKRKRKELEQISVADAILYEEFVYFYNGDKRCFLDDAPEFWDKEEKQLFDLAHKIEQELKEALLAKLDGN